MDKQWKDDLIGLLKPDTIVELAPDSYKFMYRDFITTIIITEEKLMRIAVYGSPLTPRAEETQSVIEQLSAKFENHYFTYSDNAMRVSTTVDISPSHVKELLDEINIYFTLGDYKFCLIPDTQFVKKENYLLGTVGAVIGVLPMLLLWLLPLDNFTPVRNALIISIFLSFGGFRGYLLFARDLPQYGWSLKNTLKNTPLLFGCGMTIPGLIISGACILIALLTAIHLDYLICIMHLRNYSFTSARLLFKTMMTLDSNFQLLYWKHFAFCLLSGIAGSFFSFVSTINRIPRRM